MSKAHSQTPSSYFKHGNSGHDHTHITHYYCFFPQKRNLRLQFANPCPRNESKKSRKSTSWELMSVRLQIKTSKRWSTQWAFMPRFITISNIKHQHHSPPGILMRSSKSSHNPLSHHAYKLHLNHPHCPKLVQTARSPCQWVCSPKNVLKICSIYEHKNIHSSTTYIPFNDGWYHHHLY